MLIFLPLSCSSSSFPFHGTHRPSPISISIFIFIFIARALFLHHYSYNTSCLSSPPALFLPSLLFTAASSGSSSIICFLHLHYTAYTLIALLHLLQLPQQVLHCAVVVSVSRRVPCIYSLFIVLWNNPFATIPWHYTESGNILCLFIS